MTKIAAGHLQSGSQLLSADEKHGEDFMWNHLQTLKFKWNNLIIIFISVCGDGAQAGVLTVVHILPFWKAKFSSIRFLGCSLCQSSLLLQLLTAASGANKLKRNKNKSLQFRCALSNNPPQVVCERNLSVSCRSAAEPFSSLTFIHG